MSASRRCYPRPVRAYVRLRTSEGQTAVLGPGDLIGRLAGAALQLDDGRVSEAHAMVSLRGRELKLLGLRGLFAVGGKPCDEVVLAPGQSVEVAPGLAIHVEEVKLPESLLAVEGDGLPRQVLTGSMSLVTRPQPALLPRHRGDAAAHIWDTGATFRIRVGDGKPRDLAPGDRWTLDGVAFRAVAVELARGAQTPTRLDGALHPPITIQARFDTVHIHVEGRPVVTFDGLYARLISELVAVGGPASWEVIAGEVWKDDAEDRIQLRRRWDVSLARLRRKLREARIRPDLIRAGGTGQVELLLYAGDRVEDLG